MPAVGISFQGHPSGERACKSDVTRLRSLQAPTGNFDPRWRSRSRQRFQLGGANMKRLSKLVSFSFVGVLLALALLPASAPANPAAATISFVGGGTLLDDGSVDVTLHYSCLPAISGPGGIEVTLQQGLVFGANLDTAICDGRNHSVILNMTPGPFT